MAAESTERTKRREAFELEHLRDVHSALIDLGRATTLVITQQHGAQVPDTANLAYAQASQRLTSLVGLVLDDSLRKIIDDAHNASVASLVDVSGEPFGRVEKAVLRLKPAMESVASRIREIYATISVNF